MNTIEQFQITVTRDEANVLLKGLKAYYDEPVTTGMLASLMTAVLIPAGVEDPEARKRRVDADIAKSTAKQAEREPTVSRLRVRINDALSNPKESSIPA